MLIKFGTSNFFTWHTLKMGLLV